ncbi:MAG: Macrolide export ATP-binding/permease protein MacB [bacterium ADurb.Bin212]|nr:MAG: Macrolide export ATP-binding/permease protein MacB [bacterium ADurb.Bin212]
MIRVKNISKKFENGGAEVWAVNNVSFGLESGIFCAIIGKSGSGKSTLLAMLGALDKPSQGTIDVDGKDVTLMSEAKLIDYRRNRIGFVFQNYNLVPNLSALENVMLPLEFAGINKNDRKSRAKKLLLQVGISEDKHNRKPLHLSGGEQQRVSIARALANSPKFILADEPTGNLDSNTGRTIVDLLKRLAKSENTTIIAVTHDQTIADQAEVVLQMKDGKLSMK